MTLGPVERRAVLLGGGAVAIGAALTLPRVAVRASAAGSVSPLDFGAAGDGRTDDAGPLRRCFIDAAAKRLSVDGGARTYASADSLWFDRLPYVSIAALNIRQTKPENGRCSLGFSGTDAIVVERLLINTGNAPATGDMDSTRGFHIRGGKRHRVGNVDVTGTGKMTFIRLEECVDSTFTNLHVHDCIFDDPEAPDDVVQGIHIYRTTGCRIISPRVANLTGNARYFDRSRQLRLYPNMRTRGLAVAGNRDLVIESPGVTNTEQAIDVSGSDGNRKVVIRGGYSEECGSVGVKLANSAVDCTVVGHSVTRSGMWGFLASGPAAPNLPFKTKDCTFVDCEARDVGYNNIHNDLDSVGENVQVSSGFGVVRGDFDRAYPAGIRFIRCLAEDRGGTMVYGFFNEPAPVGSVMAPNRLESCRSVGHMAAVERGFGRALG